MTPIEKNITVVDELGREYEATYPKRAKGLVKNGRARFVADDKICLACPPDKFETEDIKMSENIEKQEVNTDKSTNYTIDYILGKIAELQEQMSHLSPSAVGSSVAQAIQSIAESEDENTNYNELAESISGPFCMREEIYRKMLELYGKMYNDLAKPSLFNEAKNLAELIRNLEASGEISGLVFKSVIAPLSNYFLHSITAAEKINKK